MHALEKEMATHSNILAWRIPGMEEPGGLPSMGSHRVGHDWSDLAAAAELCQRGAWPIIHENVYLYPSWLFKRQHFWLLLLLLSISGQSGVLSSFQISGRPDGFLGQIGKKKKRRRGGGDVACDLQGGVAEWDRSGIQRQFLTLDSPLKKMPSLHRVQQIYKPLPLISFLWKHLAWPFFPPYSSLCFSTYSSSLLDSFIFLMCKVEILIKPSSWDDCEN